MYDNVPDSAMGISPILIGSEIPDIDLVSADGETVNLNELTTSQLTIILFYRGSWCPFCNRHFEALRLAESELIGMGYQLIGISPDLPENLQTTKNEQASNYLLLSDSTMEAAMAFGLAFKVDDATLERYDEYGIDLDAASGESHHLLPVPAVFIVGSDDLIGFSYVNPEYKVRLDAATLLAAANAVKVLGESE
ncbi:MAG TPA: peroxiredoxin-like family protein [bacterium]|jgi:peroxiredoxin